MKWRLRKYAPRRFQGLAQQKTSYYRLHDKEGLSLNTQAQTQGQDGFTYAQFKEVSELIARLDTQIDKTLRRLTSLKVFKGTDGKLFEPLPQIEAPPTVVDDPSESDNLPETEEPAKNIKTETGE